MRKYRQFVQFWEIGAQILRSSTESNTNEMKRLYHSNRYWSTVWYAPHTLAQHARRIIPKMTQEISVLPTHGIKWKWHTKNCSYEKSVYNAESNNYQSGVHGSMHKDYAK